MGRSGFGEVEPPPLFGNHIGRGLETVLPRREGELVCEAAALFFDNPALLEAFLMSPGNHGYADRVVKIEGVMNAEVPQTIFAVLIGAAQWAQHFENLGKRPNCVLEFVPSNGFNSNALRLAASTRHPPKCWVADPLELRTGLRPQLLVRSSCREGFQGILGQLVRVAAGPASG